MDRKIRMTIIGAGSIGGATAIGLAPFADITAIEVGESMSFISPVTTDEAATEQLRP